MKGLSAACINRCTLALCFYGLGLGCSHARSSDYGVTGLIDVPTARFEQDGAFLASASTDDRHKQFSITYQATPWLQATFRYTGFKQFFAWDRSYEVKARLSQETAVLPEVAIGVRDLVGTGLFGSEYVVASKQFGRSDFTLGLGWGRLAGKGFAANPLISLDDRFGVRSADVGLGGEFGFGNYFSGRHIGLFGGVSHEFDALPITALLEYNPDQYTGDVVRGGSPPSSQWSLGVEWQALPNVKFRLSSQHGDGLSVGFTTLLDSFSELPRRSPKNFVSSYYLSQADLPIQIDKRRWYDRLLYDVERSGLVLLEGNISDDGKTARLVVGNLSYALWSDAIAQHTAIADLHLPAAVSTIYFVVEEAGHRVLSLVVPRPSSSQKSGKLVDVAQLRKSRAEKLILPKNSTSFFTGIVNSTVRGKSRFQLFDPDDPARYQIYANIESEFALNSYWAVRSAFSVNLDQNFDESKRIESNSALPKVRSDIVKYLNEGDTGLEKFIVEGRHTLGSSLHYRIYGGYLETMFAGVGVEGLFWPFDSRIAVGMSGTLAKQRDFNRGLGLADYNVLTGHVSLFWASPFYGYDVAVHAGRYLAKDLGGTVELRRTFRNGWQVGVWATITDVPFSEFGEGSFDKGFFFKIPLDGLFGDRTRASFATLLRPIQRDGGQRLEDYSGNIFWDLRAARYDSFRRDHRLLP